MLWGPHPAVLKGLGKLGSIEMILDSVPRPSIVVLLQPSKMGKMNACDAR